MLIDPEYSYQCLGLLVRDFAEICFLASIIDFNSLTNHAIPLSRDVSTPKAIVFYSCGNFFFPSSSVSSDICYIYLYYRRGLKSSNFFALLFVGNRNVF